eukprot:jgi/Ulvmu1/193/UM001_0197.1
MDDSPGYLATPAKTTVENHFKRFYTPESSKVQTAAAQSSKFGRAKRKLVLPGQDASATVRTAQAILHGKQSQMLASCSENASRILETGPAPDAPAPGSRLTDIAKKAISIANGLSGANKSGYRAGGKYKANPHQGAKPFKCIGNESRPTASMPSATEPVNSIAPRTELKPDAGSVGEADAHALQTHPAGPKRRNVRDGGHENFVRSVMKKGKSSFKFKSKSGCSNRNPKNKRWAMHKMAAESLPVAGLGADNANEARLVCFRCGQKGHWARDCKADAVAQASVDLSWCSNSVSQLKPDAPILPSVLRPDVASALAFSTSTDTPSLSHGRASDNAALAGPADRAVVQHGGVEGTLPELVQAPGSSQQLAQAQSLHSTDPVPTQLQCGLHVIPESAEAPLKALMHDCFGYEDFKLFQLPVIQQLLVGQSCMVVQPTGAGKSLCFQLPALLLPGLVLVVSPLTAHVRDAVAKLPSCIPAGVCLGGAFKRASTATLQAAVTGRLKLLYVTPECLAMSWVADKLQDVHISLACVDEAHHASERSPTCRPGCLQLPQRLAHCAPTAIRLLLTATAAADAREGLCEDFGISPQRVWCTAPVREELQLSVAKCEGAAGDCRAQAEVLRAVSKGGRLGDCRCVLVYCCFRSHAEQLAAYLQGRGLSAMSYHAGLSAAARQEVSDSLGTGRVSVVTCTTALSTGLDCSRVDGVLHHSLPPSMEEYVQQIGRAGRGCGSANALVLLRDADLLLMHSLKHSCDCDAVAVKRILEALVDAARTASAREAAAGLKKKKPRAGRAKRTRGVETADKPAKAGPRAKRSRPAKVVKPRVPEDIEGEDAVAAPGRGGGQATKPGRRVRQQRKRAEAWEESADEGVDSSDSESEAGSEDSGDGYAPECNAGREVTQHGVRRSARHAARASACEAPPANPLCSSGNSESQGGCPGSGSDSDGAAADANADCHARVAGDLDNDQPAATAARSPQREQAAGAGSCPANPHDSAEIRGGEVDTAVQRFRGAGEDGNASEHDDVPGAPSGDPRTDFRGAHVQESACPQMNDAAETCEGVGRDALVGEGVADDRSVGAATKPTDDRSRVEAQSDHVALAGAAVAPHSQQMQQAARDGEDGVGAACVAGALEAAPAAGLPPETAAAGGETAPASCKDAEGRVVVLQTKQLATVAQVTTEAVELVLAVLGRVAPHAAMPLGGTMATLKVACYKQKPEAVAAEEPVFASVMAVGRVRNGLYTASTQAVARHAGVAPDGVQDALQRLAGRGEVHFEASGDMSVAVMVQEDDPVWDGGAAGLARGVFERLQGIQLAVVGKLEGVYRILNSVCMRPTEEQSQVLQQHIGREFAVGGPSCSSTDHDGGKGPLPDADAASAADDASALGEGLPFDIEIGKMTSLRVTAMVQEAKQRAGSGVQLTGRAVASMLHGRDMPAFPRMAWSKCPGWGSCMHVRFGDLRRHAQAKLLQHL